MNLAIITQVYPPEFQTAAGLTKELAEDLVRRGRARRTGMFCPWDEIAAQVADLLEEMVEEA